MSLCDDVLHYYNLHVIMFNVAHGLLNMLRSISHCDANETMDQINLK